MDVQRDLLGMVTRREEGESTVGSVGSVMEELQLLAACR